MSEELVPFGSPVYCALLAVCAAARAADFLSTWIATPRLVLEGNPLAKRLGWRWGAVVNGVVCLAFAAWPLAALMIATTSLLVAARNFQSAWLMRVLGEEGYRNWYVERLRQTPLPLYLACLAGQTFLVGAIGVALVWFAPQTTPPVPLAIGLGLVAYAIAVAFYTSLAAYRIRRSFS